MSKYATFLDDSFMQNQKQEPQKKQLNYVSMGYHDNRANHHELMNNPNYKETDNKQYQQQYDVRSIYSANMGSNERIREIPREIYGNEKREIPRENERIHREIPRENIKQKNIRKLLTSYFENPLLKQLKKEDGMYIYGAKIGYPLLSGYRYLFISFSQDIVNPGSYLKDELFMDDIPFTYLQTREIKDVYNLPVTNYKPKNTSEYMLPIILKQENDAMSIYKHDQFELTLLQGKHKKPYLPNGNLVKALETYNTIVTIV
jgi:hypothetical protein